MRGFWPSNRVCCPAEDLILHLRIPERFARSGAPRVARQLSMLELHYFTVLTVSLFHFIHLSATLSLQMQWLANRCRFRRCTVERMLDRLYAAVAFLFSLPLRMTYYMSFAIMVHMGFRTHDGVPLTKLSYFVQRFEAGKVHVSGIALNKAP